MIGDTKKTNIREITLIGLLSAICVVSRIMLQFLPNIKPVTAIIVLLSCKYGCKFGIKLALISTVISNMVLGTGTWTVFQIFAWSVIALLSGLIGKSSISKSATFMSCFSFFCGYIFGFLVSFEKIFYGGIKVFWAYYVAGLYFDTLHAIGNFVFMLVIFHPLNKVLEKHFN